MAEETSEKQCQASSAYNNAAGTADEAAVAQETYVASAKALGVEEILRRVMHVVGKGHHVFIATVCKEWQEAYTATYPSLETSHQSVVGSVKRVRWAKKECGYELSVSTFRAAAEYGDLSVCEELHRLECPLDEHVCKSAVRNARHGLRVLKWLRSEDLPAKEQCPWSEDGVSGEAGKCGNVEVVEWLLSDGPVGPPHIGILCEAVMAGHTNLLDTLVQHPKVRACMEAAGDYSAWRGGAKLAAYAGNVEVMQWFHANARELCRWDEHVCYDAVLYAKSLSILKWLRSEEVMCPWDSSVCPQYWKNRLGDKWDMPPAAFEEMKQWVHANGHPCDCQD